MLGEARWKFSNHSSMEDSPNASFWYLWNKEVIELFRAMNGKKRSSRISLSIVLLSTACINFYGLNQNMYKLMDFVYMIF